MMSRLYNALYRLIVAADRQRASDEFCTGCAGTGRTSIYANGLSMNFRCLTCRGRRRAVQ